MPEGHDGGTQESSDLTEILAGWRRRLRASSDGRPRAGERGLRERALVRSLLHAADSAPQDETSLLTLALSAVRYGEDVDRRRIDPGLLCAELAALRDAAWQHFRRATGATEGATERILRFDRALSVAMRATLSGSYRGEIEAHGPLGDRLRDIVDTAIAPPPRH